MNKTLTITIILLCWFTVAPFSPMRAGNPVDTNSSKNIISINLASPFDPNFPRYRIGYSRIITPDLMLSWDVGLGKHGIVPDSTFITNRTIENDYRFWEMRTEVRFLFAGARKYVTPYAAFELYYIHHTQTMYNDEFYPEQGNIEVHYGQANYFRQKYGMNAKAGLIFKIGRHNAFELYAGFGARARKNSYSNLVGSYQGGSEWFDNWNYYYYEGTKYNLNLTFGFKFDFIF